MTDLEALLAAVIAAPDEDTPRLMYADALQENGDDDRAEFIRVQCQLAQIGCSSCVPSPGGTVTDFACLCHERAAPLRARESSLLLNHYLVWFRGALPPFYAHGCTPGDRYVTFAANGNVIGLEFARGFADRVTCTAADWFEHADAIYWHPNQIAPCPRRCVTGKCYRAGLPGPVDCPTCGGTGSVPRPCPETAHPIREVTLTTWPEGDEWGDVADLLDVRGDGRLVYRCPREHAARWKGVTFALPQAPNYSQAVNTFSPDVLFTRPSW